MWAALEKECFSTPWSEEQCTRVLTQNNFAALGLWKGSKARIPSGATSVLEENMPKKQTLMAYIAFYHMFDEMEILNIAVTPSARRQGLGGLILAQALDFGREKGLQKAILEVREGNKAARHLYESFSFTCVGTRSKYYRDTGEDACIYTLAL